MPTLLAHGIAQGGYYPGPSPSYTNVTLNTTGATFIVAVYVADALLGELDAFYDSQGNVWTPVTGYPSPTDDHHLVTASSAMYWCASPTTSVAHVFTGDTSANPGSAHACLAVMAWGGMLSANWESQIWDHSGTGSLSIGPLTATQLTIVYCALGMGDMATSTGSATLTSMGWTTVDTIAAAKAPPGICGMTIGYQIFGTPTPGVSTNWTYTGGGSAGAGMFSFTFADVPPPVTTTYAIRRLRRFMLPWDDANRQKFISHLELVMQPGIGTASITSPTVMLRLSPDGGITWGHEQQMSAGALGEYSKRVFLNRLGRARNPVVEITVSDPVSWAFVQCLADMEVGTS